MELFCAPCKTSPMALRMAEIRESRDLRLEDIAGTLGVAVSTVSRWESGGTNIPTKRFDEIAAAYQCRVIDLFADDVATLHLEGVEHSPGLPRYRDGSANDETVEIISLDLSVSMGPGTLIEEFVEEERVRMGLAFVQAITRTPSDRLRLLRGIGDSMEPTLRTGDRVLVDINERALSRINGVYWIDHLGTHGIKRLRAAGRGRIMVMSDNPLVPDFEVAADELRIEGRVIWFARDL